MVDIIAPLAEALTKLPAGPSYPGRTSGISFRLSRGATIPTHKEAAWMVFRERLGELSAYCAFLEVRDQSPTALVRIKSALTTLAEGLKLTPI